MPQLTPAKRRAMAAPADSGGPKRRSSRRAAAPEPPAAPQPPAAPEAPSEPLSPGRERESAILAELAGAPDLRGWIGRGPSHSWIGGRAPTPAPPPLAQQPSLSAGARQFFHSVFASNPLFRHVTPAEERLLLDAFEPIAFASRHRHHAGRAPRRQVLRRRGRHVHVRGRRPRRRRVRARRRLRRARAAAGRAARGDGDGGNRRPRVGPRQAAL